MARNKVVDGLMAASKKIDASLVGDPAELQAAEVAEEESAIIEGPGAGAEREEPEAPPPPAEEPTPEPEPPAEEPEPKEEAPEPKSTKPESKDERAFRVQRQELARLRAQLARQNELLNQRQAQPPPVQPVVKAPVEEEDPEPVKPGNMPNVEEDPLGYDRWYQRNVGHQLWRQRQDVRALTEKLTAATEQQRRSQEEVRTVSAFDRGIETKRKAFVAANPEFEGAEAHLRSVVRKQLIRTGTPEFEVDDVLINQERQYYASHMQRARAEMEAGILPPDTDIAEYAFEMALEQAKDYGYNPEKVETKTTVKTPTAKEKVKDAQERANASRVGSKMRGTEAVELGDAEPMTAVRFMEELTPVQRAKWKKTHPNWERELGLLSDSDAFEIYGR